MIQELAKRLTQQMYPDKATDAQTLDGFSQAVMTLASQIGIIPQQPQQPHPSSSTSTAEDAHMGQSQQGSGSKRELSPTSAAEDLHKQPKDQKTS
eukprot:6334516-Karenia_brevis.AAC.1